MILLTVWFVAVLLLAAFVARVGSRLAPMPPMPGHAKAALPAKGEGDGEAA